MQHPNALSTLACQIVIAWMGLAFIAPTVMAASPASCPAGQMAATRIEYEGKYNLDPTADVLNIQALIPNVGYTKRTVTVANNYYKEVSEGVIAIVREQPPGKPVPIPGADNPTLYARELPSRFVIIETPKQRLVYDEQGDPEQPGTRIPKSKQTTTAQDQVIVGGLQAALGPATGNVKVLGQATYAGIPCEVRQALVPGNTTCIARVREQYITLAEDTKVPKPSWMKAKTKEDVCVAAREFEPPANVRFK